MIELKEVSAGYGKKEILHGISALWNKGRLISVIGSNGSGKSTLLKTVIGIIPTVSGEIFADGENISLLKRRDIAVRIAYLAQGKSVPDMTVGQMVLHGRFPHLRYPRRYTEKDRDIAKSVMEQTGISDCADMPMTSLSGGMRQNAYIAMALAQDTDYILMDEPTAYLDIAHQLELMRSLRRLADSGKCVVAVMHDLPLAFTFSDEINVIKEGKIIVSDTPQMVCDKGIVKEIFGIKLHRFTDKTGYCYDYS